MQVAPARSLTLACCWCSLYIIVCAQLAGAHSQQAPEGAGGSWTAGGHTHSVAYTAPSSYGPGPCPNGQVRTLDGRKYKSNLIGLLRPDELLAKT